LINLGAGATHLVMVSNDGAGARELVGAKNSPVRWMVLGVARSMNVVGRNHDVIQRLSQSRPSQSPDSATHRQLDYIMISARRRSSIYHSKTIQRTGEFFAPTNSLAPAPSLLTMTKCVAAAPRLSMANSGSPSSLRRRRALNQQQFPTRQAGMLDRRNSLTDHTKRVA